MSNDLYTDSRLLPKKTELMLFCYSFSGLDSQTSDCVFYYKDARTRERREADTSKSVRLLFSLLNFSEEEEEDIRQIPLLRINIKLL